MLATLLLVAVGPWSYAGMISNPKPPAVPAAAIAPPADPPARVPASPSPGVAARQAAPPVPPATPSPTIWRLADATGQVWEHADPAQLSAFVRQRNARFYPPLYTAPAYQARAARCGPSGCR